MECKCATYYMKLYGHGPCVEMFAIYNCYGHLRKLWYAFQSGWQDLNIMGALVHLKLWAPLCPSKNDINWFHKWRGRKVKTYVNVSWWKCSISHPLQSPPKEFSMKVTYYMYMHKWISTLPLNTPENRVAHSPSNMFSDIWS